MRFILSEIERERFTHLAGNDSLHRKNVDLSVVSERSVDLGSNKFASLDSSDAIDLSSFCSRSLESHVSSSSLSTEIDVSLVDLEESVIDVWSNVTISLTVHSFRSKCGSYEEDFLSLDLWL